ncbi:MAG TPA: group 1 truncated hemoglobin [Gemmataceae bacterium]|nr:group 1 truncated hemoglobin [Gemmataceae bacterium]
MATSKRKGQAVLAMCTLLFGAAIPLWAQEKPTAGTVDRTVLDRQINELLRVIIDTGADIHNGFPKQGIPHNPAGCYRLYHDALVALRPLLGYHPELQSAIDASLAEAGRMPGRTNREISEKAFALRKTIDAIRAGIGPPSVAASLWNRLGGERNVRQVVDDFVALAATDPKANFFRNGSFKDKVNVPELKSRLVELISSASGGPLKYAGRSMKEVHAGMGITDAEFDALAADLAKALAKNGAKKPEIDAVLAAVAATRNQIVEAGPAAKLPSLWEQLGGAAGVHQVIEDWLALAAADPKVNFSRGGKIKLTEAQVQDFNSAFVAYLSQITGGPIPYRGKSMRDAHRGMGITNAEFDAAVADLRKALEGRRIKPLVVQDLLKLVEATRGEIVEIKPEPAGKKADDKKPGANGAQP